MKKNRNLKSKLGIGLLSLFAAISLILLLPSAAMAAGTITVRFLTPADAHASFVSVNYSSDTQAVMPGHSVSLVKYEAESGYYFDENHSPSITIKDSAGNPATYPMTSGSNSHGLVYKRESFREISFSGTVPMDATEITVDPGTATRKAAGDSLPSSMSQGMGRIPDTTDEMEYTFDPLSPTSTWYSCIDHGSPVVSAGTYWVRYKETDTTLAGDPLKVTVYPLISFAAAPSSSHLKHTGGSLEPDGFKMYELTAEHGYYLPDGYSVILKSGGISQMAVHGVKTYGIMFYKKDSESFLLNTEAVGTNKVTITLTPATEKGQQAAPPVLGGAGKITGTTTAMEYASDPDAADGGWLVCSDGETTATPGVWYVRYRETDTLKAGAAAGVTVTEAVIPGTHTVTVQNGTLSATPGQGSVSGSYRAGDTVTVTARTPVSGSSFREWNVTTGTVSLQDKNSATTSFIMPDEDVTLEAVYDGATPPPTPEPGPGPDPEPGPGPEPGSEGESHDHHYEWVLEYPATPTSDGMEKYRCAGCSSVLERRSISGQTAFVSELLNKIRDAAGAGEPGKTLEIDTKIWMSYPKSVLLEIDKAGIAVQTTFRYQGKTYSFLIPAGRATELLTEEENFYGFLYLSDHYGRTSVE